MILFAGVFMAGGLGLLRLGKHLLRGLYFLFSLVIDWMRRFAHSVRWKLRRDEREELLVGPVPINLEPNGYRNPVVV